MVPLGADYQRHVSRFKAGIKITTIPINDVAAAYSNYGYEMIAAQAGGLAPKKAWALTARAGAKINNSEAFFHR